MSEIAQDLDALYSKGKGVVGSVKGAVTGIGDKYNNYKATLAKNAEVDKALNAGKSFQQKVQGRVTSGIDDMARGASQELAENGIMRGSSKIAGKAIKAVGPLGIALDAGLGMVSGEDPTKAVTTAAGGGLGWMAGAAAAGSVLGPAGTLGGAILGGAATLGAGMVGAMIGDKIAGKALGAVRGEKKEPSQMPQPQMQPQMQMQQSPQPMMMQEQMPPSPPMQEDPSLSRTNPYLY